MGRHKTRNGSRGFTLVELMVVLAIVSILLAGLYQLFLSQQKGYTTQDQINRMQQSARMAQTFVMDSIQSAGSLDTEPLGLAGVQMRGSAIIAASQFYITIQADDPNNNDHLGVIGPDEVVTFAISTPGGAPTHYVHDSKTGATGTEIEVCYDTTVPPDGVLPADCMVTEIPLSLRGSPYSLFRITTDAAGNPVYERIADDVDNLVFRYFDALGNPIPPDPAGGGGLTDDPLTVAELAQIRSVQIDLTLRANRADAEYIFETFELEPDTAGTYDAGGNANAVTAYVGEAAGGDDHFRRKTFTSRVSPRNLDILDCGRIEVSATQALCPNDSTVTVTGFDGNGAPLLNTDIDLSATGATGFTFTPATVNTGGAGTATSILSYAGTTTNMTVIASATVECPPGSGRNVPLVGTTVAQFLPGPPHYVSVNPLDSYDNIATCADPNVFDITVNVYDECTNIVPPPAAGPDVEFGLQDVYAPGNLLGDMSSANFTDANPVPLKDQSEVFAVNVVPDLTGAARDPVTGFYGQEFFVSNMGWLATAAGQLYGPLNTLNSPPFDPVPNLQKFYAPWPPTTISMLTNDIATLPHNDCPSGPVTDTFNVLECNSLPMYTLTPGTLDPNYPWSPSTNPPVSIKALLDPDAKTGAPYSDNLEQGALDSTTLDPGSEVLVNLPSPYDPYVIGMNMVADPANFGVWDVTYMPPSCTLGPEELTPGGGPIAETFSPDVHLWLHNDPAPPAVPLNKAGAIHDVPLALTLEQCANCQMTATPMSMTTCDGQVDLQVSGCVAPGSPSPRNVLFTVTNLTNAGRQGSFNTSVIQTTVNIAVPGNVNPWTASTTLHIGDAYLGDVLNVQATYFDAAGAQVGSCSTQVPVTNSCQDLAIYSDPNFTAQVGVGFNTCLSVIQELYFEVDDCQYNVTAPQNNAITVKLYDYNISQTIPYDEEQVDLEIWGTGKNIWRNSNNPLPIAPGGTPATNDGLLHYSPGAKVFLETDYVDTRDPLDPGCEEDVRLLTPVPVCFPNAITSGGGAGWNGNFKVHWGDVVVKGIIDLPAKFIYKDAGVVLNGLPFSGNNYEDRFADVYVGFADPLQTTGGYYTGVPNNPANFPDQPFKGSGFGNYFSNISYNKITDMIAELDYDTMKVLGQERDNYWYVLPSGNVWNPVDLAFQAAYPTGVELQEILHNPDTPANPWYDGSYIFIDTYENVATNVNTTGADIDSIPLANLPEHDIAGDFFTSGIIYIAGSLNYGGLGNTTPIAVETPPDQEVHYLHNDPGWIPTENDIPIRTDPARPQHPEKVSVHIDGGIYVDGVMTGSGNPAVFGSLTAERGYVGSGTPEIWYNYNLNVSGLTNSLCVQCCDIRINPPAVNLTTGQTIQLTAFGATEWWSEDPSVASVDKFTGDVTASLTNTGVARIGVRDSNNCTDFATITVGTPCQHTRMMPSTLDIPVNGIDLLGLQFPDPAAHWVWTSSDPAIADLITVPGQPSATVVGKRCGTVTIEARDSTGFCTQVYTATVTVTSAVTIAASPSTTVDVADFIDFTAGFGAPPYTWSSSNPNVITVFANGMDTGRGQMTDMGTATVTVTDANGCTASIDVTGICPTLSFTWSAPLMPNGVNDGTMFYRNYHYYTVTGTTYGILDWGPYWSNPQGNLAAWSNNPSTGWVYAFTPLGQADITPTLGVTGSCGYPLQFTIERPPCPNEFFDDFDDGVIDLASAGSWRVATIGAASRPTSVSEAGGVVQLTAAGLGTANTTADDIYFLHRDVWQANESFDITVDLSYISPVGGAIPAAGFMIRDGLAPDDAFLEFSVSDSQQFDRYFARTTKGAVSFANGPAVIDPVTGARTATNPVPAAPLALRIIYINGRMWSYYSTNGGASWYFYHSEFANFSDQIYVGLVSYSNKSTKQSVSQFDNYNSICW